MVDYASLLIGTTVSGLVLGLIYAALALGYNIVYRVSKAINLAQPEQVLFAAYIAFIATMWAGLNVVAAMALSLVAGFILGGVLERAVARPLRGRPPVALMAATLGVFYLLRGVTMVVSGGFETGSLPVPDELYRFGPIVLGANDIVAIVIAGGSLAALIALHQYTRIGVAMRAVAEDSFGAAAYGLPVKALTLLSWGIAGAAASAAALSLTVKAQVSPTLDYYALKALVASLLAGLDSIAGVVVGGLVLGLSEQYASLFLDPYLKGIGERMAFIIMLIVLLVKPYGLFGTERIERV